MAKKTNAAAAATKSADDKAAKRKARMEALKNRPAEQRTNSKQVDIVKISDTQEVKTFAYPIKSHGRSVGVLIKDVAIVDGNIVSVSNTFVPGELVAKVKKGHGVIVSQKAAKKGSKEEETEDED